MLNHSIVFNQLKLNNGHLHTHITATGQQKILEVFILKYVTIYLDLSLSIV